MVAATGVWWHRWSLFLVSIFNDAQSWKDSLMNASFLFTKYLMGLRLSGLFSLVLLGVNLGACQTSKQENITPVSPISFDNVQEQTETSPSFSGKFLAARHAQKLHDNAAASRFFSEALRLGNTDDILLKYSFINHYQNGTLGEAIRLARTFERLGFDFGLAAEPAIAKAVQDKDWQALIALSEKIEISDDFHILAGGLRSLSYIGLGEPETALGIFHELEDFAELSEGTPKTVLLLLGGYISELLGNKKDSESYFRQALAKSQDEYIVICAGAGLWRLGKTTEAEALWRTRLPADAAPLSLVANMQAQTSPVFNAPNLAELIARFMFDTSWLSNDSYHSNLLIARAHLAISITPELYIAHMALAEWYLKAEDYPRARHHLQKINEKAPTFLRSRIFMLALEERSGEAKKALHILKAELAPGADVTPSIAAERALLAEAGGDMLRQAEECAQALDFYQMSLDYGMKSYRLYRSIGICHERIGNDPQAEKALLRAIDLNPNDAISLNYLGYWWADEGRYLEKAITYIKKAVQLQPSSGYYADSLGWVYYRQGQFDKSILWLEKAIQLTPTDAVISEHLGDAYWQIGRLDEARFKWQHALEMGIDETRVPMIKAKLENGL